MTSNANSQDSVRSTGTPPPRWLVMAMTRTHVFLHRLSGGRLFNKLAGDEVCFVTMKGAKTGRTLTIPLMYVPYQKGVLLVASLGGAPKNPAWYGNLVKYPDIEVDHRGQRARLRARLARPDEKPTLWPICDSCYAPYADYRKRTTRDIPIFVCQPAA
jgi:deazaflavin-dependent oxidoreductase (nitroreductase family)